MKLKPPARVTISAALLAFALAGGAFAQTEVTGTTPGGAHYIFLVPGSWNGGLAIWNHGFDLSPIGPLTSLDAGPLSPLQLTEGYAVAASSYRQPGWALFKTDQDLEEMVAAFEAEFGTPTEVILTGASLGGIVTASALERADLGNVTGAYTFCGAMAGSRVWDGALDLRLIYDQVCSGVKKARIPGGAKGLEKDSNLSPDDVEKAVDKCFGLQKSDDKRKKKEQKRLDRFLELTQIPQNFIHTNMDYVTFAMSDLVHDSAKLRGKLGTGNYHVDYGDAQLDAEIERVKPKRSRAKKLAKNFTPTGDVGDVKIVSIHTDKDGLVIVENESEYASVVPNQNLSVGIVVEQVPSHCGFTPAEVVAGWEALRAWIGGASQPSTQDLQDYCLTWEVIFDGPCRIDPNFEIPNMDGRIRPR